MTTPAVNDATVSKLYRSYWQFTSLPAGSTLATTTPYGPSSGLYRGTTNATSGIFNMTPNVALALIPGTYTVQLVGRLTDATGGTGFTATLGGSANDNLSITALPLR